MKKLLLTATMVAALFVGGTSAVSATAFSTGKQFVGPHIGYGWHGLDAGFWYEYAVWDYIGVGADVSVTYGGWAGYAYYGGLWGGYTGTYAAVNPVGIRGLFTVSGHIPIRKVPDLDIFIKMGLGYGNHIFPNAKYYDRKTDSIKTKTAIHHYFAYHFGWGVRYFFGGKKVGIRAELAWPTWFRVGVDFKI